MGKEIKTLGYHTNTVDECNKMLDKSYYYYYRSEKGWLGSGLYFWDNFGNSKYWSEILCDGKKCHICNENKKECFSIIKVTLEYDENEIFDITDKLVRDMLEEQWEKIINNWREKNKKGLNTSLEDPNLHDNLGDKINYLLDFWHLVEDGSCKIIKAIEYKKDNLFEQSYEKNLFFFDKDLIKSDTKKVSKQSNEELKRNLSAYKGMYNKSRISLNSKVIYNVLDTSIISDIILADSA